MTRLLPHLDRLGKVATQPRRHLVPDTCPLLGDTDGKSVGGRGYSTWVASKSKEPDKRPGQKDYTVVSATLLKAGEAAPHGKDVGSIPKLTSEKEYAVDYSWEPCPPPTFKIDPPAGSHLGGAPSRPKSTWESNAHMSQATLHGHIHAIAQAGYQHALYHTFEGLMRMRNEAYHVWDHSAEAFKQHAREPVFVDEVHAGTIMLFAYGLQARRDDLTAELKSARQNIETAHHKTKEARCTARIMDQQIADLKKSL